MPSPIENKSKGSASKRRLRRRVCALLVSVLLLGLGCFGALYFTGNIHAVVADECYRSAQLSSGQLAKCATTYGIKTIINLRGANLGKGWYDKEVAEAKRLGISHIDFRMSASQELSVPEAEQLIDIMKNAQKPLLVHCQGGADRSGLASALYLAAIHKSDEDAAEAQLSIRFGHFPISFLPAYAMDRTFEKLEPSLGFH